MSENIKLLNREFPGWSVYESADGCCWMWRGDGPRPTACNIGFVRPDGTYIPLGEDPPQMQAPDFLAAAERVTGQTRFIHRPKCCHPDCVEPATLATGTWSTPCDYTETCAKHLAQLVGESDSVYPVTTYTREATP